MEKEDVLKKDACKISDLSYRVQPMMNDLLKTAENIVSLANDTRIQMKVLRKKTEELKKALKRIDEGIIIVAGTIFMDGDEEQTLHDFIKQTLKTWG